MKTSIASAIKSFRPGIAPTLVVLLLLAGAASLIGRPGALGELNASPAGAALVLDFRPRSGGLLKL